MMQILVDLLSFYSPYYFVGGEVIYQTQDKGGSHLYDPIYGMGCGGEYFPGFHLCNFLRLNSSFVREFKGLKDQTKKGFPEKFPFF